MPIIEYFGRFHPLITHLPIGIFAVVFLLHFLPHKEGVDQKKYWLQLLMLLTTLSATFSVITGLILARSGSYGKPLVTQHQWLAIGFTLISLILYVALKRSAVQPLPNRLVTTLLLVGFILILLTGHAGGSLTHGSDFLSPPPISRWFDKKGTKEIILTEKSGVYDAVALVMKQKCYSCHGPNRQKGGLRLDQPDYILAGGEGGSILSGEHINTNVLLQRITLPLDDEKHMPPKEKSQLTESEVLLLTWWIEHDHPFDLSIANASWPASLKSAFLFDKSNSEGSRASAIIPVAKIQPAREPILDALQQLNVAIVPYAIGSQYLAASLYNVNDEDLGSAIEQLSQLNPQLLSLKIANMPLDEGLIQKIGKIRSLQKLTLDHCALSNNDLRPLQSLENLEYLNIIGNQITGEGLLQLSALKKLGAIYLWQNPIQPSDFTRLQSAFENVRLDSGNYVVPTYPSDTTVLRAADLN